MAKNANHLVDSIDKVAYLRKIQRDHDNDKLMGAEVSRTLSPPAAMANAARDNDDMLLSLNPYVDRPMNTDTKRPSKDSRVRF